MKKKHYHVQIDKKCIPCYDCDASTHIICWFGRCFKIIFDWLWYAIGVRCIGKIFSIWMTQYAISNAKSVYSNQLTLRCMCFHQIDRRPIWNNTTGTHMHKWTMDHLLWMNCLGLIRKMAESILHKLFNLLKNDSW